MIDSGFMGMVFNNFFAFSGVMGMIFRKFSRFIGILLRNFSVFMDGTFTI